MTSATLTANIMTYYDKFLLDRLEAKLWYTQFSDKKRVPRNSGKTAVWTRYTNFAANTTALTEGTVPSEISLSSSNVSAVVSGYGDFVKISDLLIMAAIDPVIKSTLDVLSYRAAKSIDTLIRDEISAATSQLANGKAALSAVGNTDVLTAAEIRKAVKTLKTQDAQSFDDGSFVLVISPECSFDLQGETATGGFIDVNKYVNTKPLYKGEIGSLYGARIVETTNAYSTTAGTSGNAEVFWCNLLAKNSIGIVSLDDGNLKTFVNQLASGATSDPIGQIATVGYKFYFAAKTLDSNRIVNIKAGTAA
ncbi:MAG: N4-gp56 family major capsid protein [Planctomycetota bacterium]|nr:N4-gp56 family major capsid protein [Planctomycetota bacterium]